DFVDISAPGVGIRTTMLGDGYGGFSGTSASSPVVAAVYALVMSANTSL
ncbi:MAG: S8 family serine peptidase, partial [Gammaproteobacteria bacterium]|nr:S8 family serine peptidase [Gammaproteobacteria bacterium]